MGRAAPDALDSGDGHDEDGTDSDSALRGYLPVPRAREEQRARARDPRTPVGELRRLARSRHWDVRAIVAARPEVPATTVSALVRRGPWAVQAQAARRPDLTLPLQQKLVVAVNLVRLPFASNPTLQPAIVARLLRDYDGYVLGVAAGNPGAAPEALEQLVGDMTRPAWVLRNVARNPSCPPALAEELLTWLAIGGAGEQDPYFDPITCTGHADMSRVAPFQWYQRQALTATFPEGSSLWRVRAATSQTKQRLSRTRVRELAVDEAPEVRRVAATYFDEAGLKVLARDDDPQVRTRAEATLRQMQDLPRRERAGKRFGRTRTLRFGLIIAVVALLGVARACVDNDDRPAATFPRDLGAIPPDLPPTLVPTANPAPGSANAFTDLPSGGLTFAGAVTTTTLADGSTIVTGTTSQLGTQVGQPLLLRVTNHGRGVLEVASIATERFGGVIRDLGFSPITLSAGGDRDILYVGSREPTSFQLGISTVDGLHTATVPVPESASPAATEG
jgi:hypothetical protein